MCIGLWKEVVAQVLRFGDDLCPSSPKADVKNALPVGAVEINR
jgi:hypothetical protein